MDQGSLIYWIVVPVYLGIRIPVDAVARYLDGIVAGYLVCEVAGTQGDVAWLIRP